LSGLHIPVFVRPVRVCFVRMLFYLLWRMEFLTLVQRSVRENMDCKAVIDWVENLPVYPKRKDSVVRRLVYFSLNIHRNVSICQPKAYGLGPSK